MINHLRHNWHRHLALYASALAFAILLTGLGAGAALAHVLGKGGFRSGPMPPRITISGGTTPASASLAASIVRIHNQGSSSSCVGQTLSTIAEIVESERANTTRAPAGAGSANIAGAGHTPPPLSAGFIYDQANGGHDNGTSWQAAFAVLTGEGDPPLSAFPHDGIDWWVQPDPAAIAAARPHRFNDYRSIDPTDSHTIQSELAAGRPLGLAIPVHDGFYFHACTTPLVADPGSFHFWHAVTVIGYSPTGIRILNSWGPSWGCNGQGTISWPLLAAYAAQGASIVVANPILTPPPTTPTPPKHTPLPAPGTRTCSGLLSLTRGHNVFRLSSVIHCSPPGSR